MLIHYLFRLIVIEYKVCDISYFMDRMEEWEVNALVDMLPYAYRNYWDMTREMVWIQAQVNSKKKIKKGDIYKFVWDDEHKDVKDTYISNDDVKRLRERAKAININNLVME